MLKLNSIPDNVFANPDVSDNKIKLNNGSSLSRKKIIALGRLVACDSFGRMLNTRANASEKFESYCERRGVEFAKAQKKTR